MFVMNICLCDMLGKLVVIVIHLMDLVNEFFSFFINYFNYIIKVILNSLNILGIGDWGLGIGDWGLGPIPNPQSPIPHPHVIKNFQTFGFSAQINFNNDKYYLQMENTSNHSERNMLPIIPSSIVSFIYRPFKACRN